MSVESTSDLSRTMLCSHLEFYFVPKEAVIVQRRVLLDILLKLLGTPAPRQARLERPGR